MPDNAGRGALLVGLDLGTGACKAVLASGSGAVLHVASRPTPTRSGPGGAATHDPAALIAVVEELLAECGANAAAGPIAGIGIASMAEAGIGLDRSGEPLGEILAWFDSRPAADAEGIAETVGRARLFAVTGLRPQAKCSLARLAWLRHEAPDSFARMHAWAGVADLAAHHLTGALGTDASLASRTLAFALAARAWSPELLGLAGIDPDRMPRVLPAGAPVGGLRPEVASRLGLAAGTPVTVAGHDHVVGAFAAGVVEPGDALDSMGTAEPVLLVTGQPDPDEALRAAGMSLGCHVLDDRWYVLAGLQASGAVVTWFVETFLPPAPADGAVGPAERYAAFLRLLEQAPPGPSEVTVLPYLRGRSAPQPDPDAGVTIAGLRAGHGLADIAAATVEGAAFAVRWMAEALERATGTGIRDVRVIGGATRNDRWMRAKAAVSPWRLEVLETEEAVALGAALLGGVAGGVFGSPGEALRIAGPRSRPLTPVPGASDAYERVYRDRFLPLARSTVREAPGD